MKKFKKLISALLLLMSITIVKPMEANAAYWKQDSNNHWNYVQDNGCNAVGWRQVDGKWYYFNENEVMQTGWISDRGNWYYCYGDGSLATNTTIDGCYLNGNGAWTTAPSANNIATTTSVGQTNNKSQMVYITATGKRYHRIAKCGNSKYVSQTTLEDAQNRGLTACGNCWQKIT